jgi:hypothetical protein
LSVYRRTARTSRTRRAGPRPHAHARRELVLTPVGWRI